MCRTNIKFPTLMGSDTYDGFLCWMLLGGSVGNYMLGWADSYPREFTSSSRTLLHFPFPLPIPFPSPSPVLSKTPGWKHSTNIFQAPKHICIHRTRKFQRGCYSLFIRISGKKSSLLQPKSNHTNVFLFFTYSS